MFDFNTIFLKWFIFPGELVIIQLGVMSSVLTEIKRIGHPLESFSIEESKPVIFVSCIYLRSRLLAQEHNPGEE